MITYFGIRDLLALLAQLLCFREVGIQLRDNIVGTCSTWGLQALPEVLPKPLQHPDG